MNSGHNLNISSPVNGKLCYVDSLLNVNFSLDNTDSLKYVSVSFQGVKYYDTSKTVSYNFNILVNGNELDSSFLTVSATYISGDTIDISEDYKTLFVRTNYPVVDFKVDNDFYYLIKKSVNYP
ncbi:MAG: hypothetical protein IPN57_05135 [Ignavibacteria bacterium]|nr:hypothetical protein [Ignavibacteria bacterium]